MATVNDMSGNSSSLAGEPWEPLDLLGMIPWKGLILAVIIPLGIHYVFRVSQSLAADPAEGGTRKPVQHPYMLPLVGNTLQFVMDTEKFLFRLL